MTRKQIIHTLAFEAHARNISALSPALNGFYEHWLGLISDAERKVVKDYNAAFADIAKQGVAHLEKLPPQV